MSHRLLSVRDRWRSRLRGAAVVAAGAGLALPLLVASGGTSTTVDAVLAAGRAQVGDAYLWGGNGPDAWDCSGFTSYVWGTVGGVAGMPRTSGQQLRWAVPIPKEQLLPGDLVFYGEPVSHVALYAGDGRVVDASSAKRGVVERALWTAPVVRYGRVPREGMPPVTPWTPPPLPTPSASPATAGAAGQASAPASSATATASPRATATAVPTRAATRPTATPTPTRAVGPATAGSTPRATSPARPPGKPVAKPVTKPVTKPVSKPVSKPVAKPVVKPVVKPVATPAAAPSAVRPLADLPAAQAAPSSPLALKAVAGARSVVGSRAFTDLRLVREAWRHAGARALPATREGVVALARQVPRPDVRVGDLVVYGAAEQLYVYAGKGYMVGHSPAHGSVVARRVHTGDVRFVRLPG